MDLKSIDQILLKIKKIPEVIMGFIAYQILQGLNYLHKDQKIIHRDIKPSNLLLNSNGQVKIADFGVSGQLIHTNDDKKTWVGTAKYMSPERYLGNNYNASTDIWSFGMVILECVTGQYPFKEGRDLNNENGQSINFFDLMDAIINQDYSFHHLQSSFTDHMIDFVKICLSKNSKARMDTSFLLQHSFIQKYQNIQNNYTFVQWLLSIQSINEQ